MKFRRISDFSLVYIFKQYSILIREGYSLPPRIANIGSSFKTSMYEIKYGSKYFSNIF